VEKSGSPGGARPKVLLTIDGEEWLIKFPAQNDPQDMGITEFKYSQAARKSGIQMTESRLFEEKYFGTKRFDRISMDPSKPPQKIHVITASGLLNASHKYPSLDYKDLLKATHILTRSMKEVKKLFRLMAFNVINNNKDDHAKNFSFLYCDEDKQWHLAPAYDLVSSTGFNGNHSTTINGKGNPTADDMLSCGLSAGLKKENCIEIIKQVESYKL
jgi:serine/threonine-protein kinase HipA